MFWCMLGGPLSLSLKIYEERRAEYDSAVAAGRQGSLLRTAPLMLCKTTQCRQQFDEWHFHAGQPSLQNFSQAFITLQEYALSTIVERRVEEIHKRVKALGN